MIKDILKQIKPEDLRVLQYSHSNELTQIVKIEGSNNFVGVNVTPSDKIIVEEVVGSWCYGRFSYG